jgi:hypothetical protein
MLPAGSLRRQGPSRLRPLRAGPSGRRGASGDGDYSPAAVGTQRWIYVVVVVLGVVVGLAIAGIPSQHNDPPLRLVTTTTLAPPAAR